MVVSSERYTEPFHSVDNGASTADAHSEVTLKRNHID